MKNLLKNINKKVMLIGLFILFVVIYLVFFMFNTSNDTFETTWIITNENEKIELPLIKTDLIVSIRSYFESYYDFDIDWGDGMVEHINYDTCNHIYETPGVYTVKINGIIKGWSFEYNSLSSYNLLTIENWGCLQLHNYTIGSNRTKKAGFFMDCKRLNIKNKKIDKPDLSQVTSLENMFLHAYVFDKDVSNWNISIIENLSKMFYDTNISITTSTKILNKWNYYIIRNNIIVIDLFSQHCNIGGDIDFPGPTGPR